MDRDHQLSIYIGQISFTAIAAESNVRTEFEQPSRAKTTKVSRIGVAVDEERSRGGATVSVIFAAIASS
jgi:hypothetical protein